MKRILTLLTIVIFCGGTFCIAGNTRHADWTANAVIYELNTRQATPEGTFAAAEPRLAQLRDMGVDVIWLMPIYPIGIKDRKGTLGSYYSIRDYCNVNPEFGTLEDFYHFLAEAHRLGLKVILDWVANHTSPDHPWVTEKPADWYVRDASGKTVVEYDWTDIAKLNYKCPQVRTEMEKCMRFWLDRGIDGFRCDVAYKVPEDFWADVLPKFRMDYGRGLYFLAEGEEAWLHRAGFDATYAWKLHHLLNDTAKGRSGVRALTSYIRWNASRYPSDAYRLAFTSNHDENSWSGTEFTRMGDAWKAMTVLCWTLPDTQPLIYTGQEIGLDHSFKFFEKDPIAQWKTNAVTDFYRSLATLRHSHPALRSDNAAIEILSTSGETIVYRRTLGSDRVTVSVQLKAPWKYSITTDEDRIAHLDPPCWWTGMKTPLQLMVNGRDISSWGVRIEGGEGVKADGVVKPESPDYLFVNVSIASTAKPGTYRLVFTRGKESFSVPYQILERREGSARRSSFTTSDAIYLIMPDRFANGDRTNDSTPDTAEKADTAAFFGRHGGDIQGIEDQLGYIAGSGFTAIWNTPLLEDNEPTASYHGYACTDYYKIDSRFGSNWKYRELVTEAHRQGLKMIMDIVTNHCGDAHWWMKDLPYKDWIHQWPKYTHTNCEFSVYNDPYCSKLDRENMEGGWFDTSMADMNLDNPYLLQYFKQWAVWWIEWADLDGLRVDTFPYNEKGPISEWCKSVRAEYPDINIVGEVWSTNVPQVAYWQAGNPNKDGYNSNLPSIMDFPLQSAISGAINTDHESWGEGLTRIYDSMANDFYYQDPSHIMIFAGNHDTDRIGDVLQKDPDRLKLVMAMLGTLRGIPQVFAGDELMAVSRDRTQGHGGLRVEFPQKWSSDPVQKDLHDYFQKLFLWRKTCEAVQKGNTMHFVTRDNTYAYFRYLPDGRAVFVFLNNNPAPHGIPWADYSEITSTLRGEGINVITSQPVDPASYSVPAKSALIVEYK